MGISLEPPGISKAAADARYLQSAGGGALTQATADARYLQITNAFTQTLADARYFTQTQSDGRYPRTGLPTWAGTGLLNPYNPIHNVYNFKAGNQRLVNAAFARALDGSGKADVVVIGDSLGIGFNGVVPATSAGLADRYSWPRQAIGHVVNVSGAQLGGTGICYASPTAGADLTNELWTKTGTVVFGGGSNASGLASLSPGATLTFTAAQAGSLPFLFYGDLSGTFSVSVNGATSGANFVNVTPTATASTKMVTMPAVTDALGVTIKVTNTHASALVYVVAAEVARTTGIRLHNLSVGGGRATTGTGSSGANNWTDSSGSASAVTNTRRACLTLRGITAPDAVWICVGPNDIANNTAVANVIAGLTTINGWWPNASKIHVTAGMVPGTTQSLWDAYLIAKYQLADTLNVPLVDWQDRSGASGSPGEYQNNGSAGQDNVHPTWATSADWGKNVGQLIAA